MGEALVGTDKPILVTTGLASLAPGRVATEADVPPLSDPNYPRRSEAAAAALAERGVRVGVIRLATTVHGIGDPAFMAMLARLARGKGLSAYIGDGANRLPAVHVSDAGRLYRWCWKRAFRPALTMQMRRRASPSVRSPRRSDARSTCPSNCAHASIRLARRFRWGQLTRVERAHACAYRLDAYRADPARRPRPAGLFWRVSSTWATFRSRKP